MLDFLFVGAHPDDEGSVTGILIKAKKEGKKTGIVTFTKGESGGFASKETRANELKNAAKMMELDYLRNLDFPDAAVEVSDEAVDALIKILVETKPEVVLTIHPDDYHPDHRAVSLIVDKAVFRAGLKKNAGAETWHPKQVLYVSLDRRTNASRPNLIIDITDVAEQKYKAISQHESQEVNQWFETDSLSMGSLGGFKYGEGLYIRQPLRLDKVSHLINYNKIGR